MTRSEHALGAEEHARGDATLCITKAVAVCLRQGVVELVSDYTVCKAGDALTPNQAALLRVFEVKQAAFRITPTCRWEAEGELPQCCRICGCYIKHDRATRLMLCVMLQAVGSRS